MAAIKGVSGKFTIQSADAFYLGNPGGDSTVGTYAIMLVSNSFSGSITVKARIREVQAWQGDTITPVAWSYLSYYLNGAATSGVQATAITGTSVILVPASGLQIVLDCTSFTSGSMTVYTAPCVGAAA